MATSLENIDKSKVSAQRIEGLTEAIQSELSGAITGGASTIVTNDLTASRALISNANGKVAVSSITSTKLGYLTDVTSNIQSQIDGKQATITGGATTVVSSNLTANRALISNSSGKIGVSSITSTKLGYLTDVTSNIQAQINNCSQAIVGSIIPYAGSSAPSGYLLCDGSAISRTTYSALFAVIGTTYGEGDGNSTFNIPEWSSVITAVSIPSTIAVYGNGKEIGIMRDSSTTFSLTTINGYYASTGYNGRNIGDSMTNNSDNSRKAMGITTDSSKSGIVAKSDSIIKTSQSYKFCIKY